MKKQIKNTTIEEDKEQLIQRFKIENSPFESVLKDEKHHLVIGDNLLTNDKFDSLEEVMDYLESHKWDIIVNVGILIAKTLINKI